MKRTRAQVAKAYRDAGIRQPNLKLTEDELQARLNQRSVRFDHKTARHMKTRKDKRNQALRDWQ